MGNSLTILQSVVDGIRSDLDELKGNRSQADSRAGPSIEESFSRLTMDLEGRATTMEGTVSQLGSDYKLAMQHIEGTGERLQVLEKGVRFS